jgi:hypothetical protein
MTPAWSRLPLAVTVTVMLGLSATASQQDAARPAGEEVQRRGCLVVDAATAGATADAPPTIHLRTTGSDHETLTLVKAPRTPLDLASHDGKFVEVRGIEYREGTETPHDTERTQGGRMQDVGQAAAVDPPAREEDSQDRRGTRRPGTTLQVSHVRVLAEACPAR